MKYVIWGTGYYGEQAVKCLKEENIVAYIDSDKKKIGGVFHSKRVITYKQYLDFYQKYAIVIAIQSPQSINEIVLRLDEKDIIQYFIYIDNPGELILEGKLGKIPFDEMLLEKCIIEKEINYGILGANLFSMLLYEYLDMHGYKKVFFITDMNPKFENYIERETEYRFAYEKEIKSEPYKILITDRKIGLKKKEYGVNKNEIIFYSFSYLKRYQYPKLKILMENYFSIKRCFIVATGPSLKISDLDAININHEISFGMNRSYLAFEKTEWRPDFYVVTDGEVMEQNAKELIKLDVRYKLFSDESPLFWSENRGLIEEQNNIYKYHVIRDETVWEEPEISDNIENGIYWGGSVVYDCLQMAFSLGFREIYLIGTDCNIEGSARNDSNHFIKGYYGTNIKNHSDFTHLFAAYRRAHKYAEEHGIKIYNATRGGMLEEFPRVDFDEVCKK
ncbi:MAG: DUF115 domain-containing protein [Butyrivibrio sp.]|jgi:hypothetical protein|nr:DUF115 domain-containing protein [Butyrivibrio sp.]